MSENLKKGDLELIYKTLQQKKVNKPCPRCGEENFAVVDGYVSNVLQDRTFAFSLSGKSVPSILTACVNCGFLSQHALGILGLLHITGRVDVKEESDKGAS